MRLQPAPKGRPGTCLVIPGKAADPRGFVCTGTVLAGWDPEVCVSVTGIEQLMRVAGFPSRDAFEALEAERDRLAGQVRELAREVEELSRFVDAIDTIESRDFRARKRPGRKKKEEVAV